MRRSLNHFWRINLAVVLGAAVATAVLTGALLVGDSVRGSLRDLTLDRLGKIDYALVTHKYFREDLLVDLATSKDFKNNFETIASAILSNGTAIHSTLKTRASNINIVAVDEQFFSFYETDESAALRKKSGQVFPSIVINQSLQNQLKAEIGDQILLSFEKPSDIAPRYHRRSRCHFHPTARPEFCRFRLLLVRRRRERADCRLYGRGGKRRQVWGLFQF